MKPLDELQREFEVQLAAAPNDLDARANLAHTLQLRGQYRAAESEFETVLGADPKHPQALTNYCKLLEHGSDGLSRIEALCQRALMLQPGNIVAVLCLARALVQGLRAEEGLGLMEAALRQPLANGPLQRELLVTYLFYLGYSDMLSPERMVQSLRGARRWLQRHFPPPVMFPSCPTDSRDCLHREAIDLPPLKVGVLCADAYLHPVGQLLAAFLEHVDKDRAAVTLYDLSPRSDHITRQLVGCTRYVPAHNDSADALARRIRADCIEVLLDTASVTHPVILAAVAQRCAPVQLTWGGWVYSHPLATVDGFIADSFTVPEGGGWQFLQPVYRLPDCVYAYRPQEPRPKPAQLPALRNGFVTFGSFNHLAKVNSSTLDLWAAVLSAVPEARMVIKAATIADRGTRERLAQALGNRGIAPQRLVMCMPTQYDDYLKDFDMVDIALDCVPFNGGMTTIDGLWQGVPLLALNGSSHAARVGASLMRAAGLSEWVADNADDYVVLARHVCRDVNAIAGIRATLPEQLEANSLGKVQEFAGRMMDIWEEAAGGYRGQGAVFSFRR